ncbi:MAG: hypothetical protein WBD77_06770, partial [Mycobacterium sp.]
SYGGHGRHPGREQFHGHRCPFELELNIGVILLVAARSVATRVLACRSRVVPTSKPPTRRAGK